MTFLFKLIKRAADAMGWSKDWAGDDVKRSLGRSDKQVKDSKEYLRAYLERHNMEKIPVMLPNGRRGFILRRKEA